MCEMDDRIKLQFMDIHGTLCIFFGVNKYTEKDILLLLFQELFSY